LTHRIDGFAAAPAESPFSAAEGEVAAGPGAVEREVDGEGTSLAGLGGCTSLESYCPDRE
jgi:hypothetical protein